MRWQVRASLPFRQRGHACVPNYSASKDASPDSSGMTCASCEATETCGRTGFSQRTQVDVVLVEPLAMAGLQGRVYLFKQ